MLKGTSFSSLSCPWERGSSNVSGDLSGPDIFLRDDDEGPLRKMSEGIVRLVEIGINASIPLLNNGLTMGSYLMAYPLINPLAYSGESADYAHSIWSHRMLYSAD